MVTQLERSSGRAARLIGVASWLLFGVLSSARADVIVLANRTPAQISVVVTPLGGQPQRFAIPTGDAVPVFLDGRANVEFPSRGRAKRYLLDANCAYYIGRTRDGGNDLQKIGLGEDDTSSAGRSLPVSIAQAPSSAMIPVRILVDEEEAARQVMWDRRLRARIEAASALLEKASGVRLQVVGTGYWNSDNSNNDFFAALDEFEKEVRPFPARLAIGFTSQFTPVVGRTHLAGTRGPLHTHILVREGNPQLNEAERLEFLVHELGHYLGASHSPEKTSVMRPVLGDNRAGTPGYRTRFDPVNTLLMSLYGEEMRRNNAQDVAGFTPDTRRRLRQIYTELSRAFPDDPASKHFVALMGASGGPMPLASGTKQVLQEIVRAAVANTALPAPAANAKSGAVRRVGDHLTDYYVRRAAQAANTLPPDVAPYAFLLALGIALDDSDTLLTLPNTAPLISAVETPRERAIRVKLIGDPTIRGRRDLAQHFFVAAHLAATLGAAPAETLGLGKELLDSSGQSGFSFADLAADRAGIRFAESVIDKKLPMLMLANGFAVPAFVPSVKELPEGLTATDLASRFGGEDDQRFQQQLQIIDRRIQALPPYRNGNAVLTR